MMKLYIVLIISFLCFAEAQTLKEINQNFRKPEMRQFDFWIGEWQVNNRFLQDDNSWQDEGQGHLKVWPVLDGKGILEFWDGTARNGRVTKGFSLRYFDPEREKWIVCLNWPAVNSGGFFLMQGKFRLNRCEIFNQFKNKDKQIVMNRYTFSDITDSTYRWNDGQSLDSGRTWQTNWVMENYRLADDPDWPDIREKFHSYSDDSFATLGDAQYFHNLQGRWQGTMSDSGASGAQTTAIDFNCWKVQNGIAMFYQLVGENGYKEVGLLTYRDQNEMWLNMRLDNLPETGFITQYSKVNNPAVPFTEYSQLGPKPTTEITRFNFEGKTLLSISRQVKTDAANNITSVQKIELKKQVGL